MQPLLPIFVVLVLLALLLPPAFLLATVLHQQRRIGWTTRSPTLAAATVAAVLAICFNTLFVILRLGDILLASLQSDAFLILALTISWFSFFGRIALKSTFRRKRKLKQSRAG
ncbi:MAG: hypothetical protein WBN04_13670 [Paracoccaceae bacterium]